MLKPAMRGMSILLVAVVLAVTGAAQEPATQEPSLEAKAQEPAAKAQETGAKADEPAVLSVEALTYGAALKEHAKAELREWVRKHLRGEFRKDAVEAERVTEQVKRKFPEDSPATQDAIVYLSFYLAYEEEEAMQGRHRQSLEEMDREMKRLEDRIRFWEDSFQHPPPGSAAGRQRAAEMRGAQERLERLTSSRQLTKNAEALSRRKVDSYLRWLNEAHQRMADVPPEVVAGVRARPESAH